MAIAFAVVKVFKLIGGHAIPRLDAVSAGWPVLLFGFVSAALAAVIAAGYWAFSRPGTPKLTDTDSDIPPTVLGRRNVLRFLYPSASHRTSFAQQPF